MNISQQISIKRRPDNIYHAFVPNSQRETIAELFNQLGDVFQSHPQNEPLLLLADGSEWENLPSATHLLTQMREFYRHNTPPSVMYVAYVYPRNDVMFNMFTGMVRTIRLNSPRRFFTTLDEAIAWLLQQQP